MTYEALEGKDLNISCLKELNQHKIYGILVNCMLFLLPIALIWRSDLFSKIFNYIVNELRCSNSAHPHIRFRKFISRVYDEK